MKDLVHLSLAQKRLLAEALNFGAATHHELARWSGVDVRTVFVIARRLPGFVNNSKRCRYEAAYKECWR